MRHEYYYYNKEELLKNPKIPLIVMEDNPAVFRSMAEEMVEEIKRKKCSWRENGIYLPGWTGWPVSLFCRNGQ